MTRITGLTATESAAFGTVPGVASRGRSFVEFTGSPAAMLSAVTAEMRQVFAQPGLVDLRHMLAEHLTFAPHPQIKEIA